MTEPIEVALVAGETSGDMHGARLVAALSQKLPGARFWGVGGPALAEQGVDLLYRAEELSLVGFSEVLPKLRVILGALNGMKQQLRLRRPALLVLIDFPDFNFRLAKAAKRLGLRVLYYISPQVWAWRPGRARRMARLVDHLACTFPFEPEFFAHNAPELPVSFVGHPLLDAPQPEANLHLPVPAEATVVGLLPGSRQSEIRRLLPLLVKAARRMRGRRDDLHFVLPVAPGLDREILEPYLSKAPPGLTVLEGRARQVMQRSQLLLVASGTATLEAALVGTPMVVVYKTGMLNYLLARTLIKVGHIGMPNLVAGREVVPELIQGRATPRRVAAQGLALLDDEQARREMSQGLELVRQRMGGPGASQRVAELALRLMEEKAR